jgi:bifunctional DNA-binding transcriptional regulator/antitoxin component of YhaV-PrlF toxin-antitoxin module
VTEEVKKRRGETTISRRHQVTVPVDAMRAAGLRPSNRLKVFSAGAGRVLLERIDDPLAEFAGALTGKLDRALIEGLRREGE